jgi:hypothetical protein
MYVCQSGDPLANPSPLKKNVDDRMISFFYAVYSLASRIISHDYTAYGTSHGKMPPGQLWVHAPVNIAWTGKQTRTGGGGGGR